MTPPALIEQKIAPYRTAAASLVTAPSFLIDRFVPDCEIIALPPKEVSGGMFRFGLGPLPSPEIRSAGLRQLLRGKPTRRRLDGAYAFDLRMRSPQNWAHFLTNHLPIYFHVCAELDLAWEETQILLPKNTPGYIRAVAEIFGLRTQLTDDTVEGNGVFFEAEPWTGIRAARFDWVRLPRILNCLDVLPNGVALPERVFLSRKSTRRLSNAEEVERFLAARGFVTLYPEDFSAADQFRLFREVETIVAIHGAGLGPLLYRPAHSRLRQLIEIMPCGHMTDVYRVMAEQVGCAWIGVRGKLKPEYVEPAYHLKGRFDAFSLDTFELDITSLARAFELINQFKETTVHG